MGLGVTVHGGIPASDGIVRLVCPKHTMNSNVFDAVYQDEVCKVKTKIIYEDRDILVVQKPPGLATQTAKVGQQDVVSELKNYLAAKFSGGQIKREPYLGIIHRLDQPVEGLLVFAENRKAAAALTAQLRGEKEGGTGTLNKFYYGVFCGNAPNNSGELIDDLYKDSSGKAMVWEQSEAEKPPQAKRAVLQYHVLQTEQVRDVVLSLVKIHIETGRYHQIRAQMSHAGMSLLGDAKYADAPCRAISQKLNIRNVALCAFDLEFYHPITKEKMSFQMKPQGEVFSFFSVK